MRTLVILVILLLTLGLGWGSVPAMAEGNAEIQQMPLSCQPLTDAELAQFSGMNGPTTNLCRIAHCFPPGCPEKVILCLSCL